MLFLTLRSGKAAPSGHKRVDNLYRFPRLRFASDGIVGRCRVSGVSIKHLLSLTPET